MSSEGVSEGGSDDYDDDEWHGIGESVEHADSDLNEEADTPKLSYSATSLYFRHETCGVTNDR